MGAQVFLFQSKIRAYIAIDQSQHHGEVALARRCHCMHACDGVDT